MNYFVLLALLVVSVHQLNASAIECESVNAHGYWGSMANKVDGKQTCFLQETTSIDSPGSTISSDVRTVGKLRFDGNKKIHYLPDNVHNTFKNLMHYWAFDCSLTEISRSNFEKLSNMRTLLLHTNQIVKINSNTFKDLRVLETLELRKKICFDSTRRVTEAPMRKFYLISL